MIRTALREDAVGRHHLTCALSILLKLCLPIVKRRFESALNRAAKVVEEEAACGLQAPIEIDGAEKCFEEISKNCSAPSACAEPLAFADEKILLEAQRLQIGGARAAFDEIGAQIGE